jgi:ferredoxin
MRVSVDPELCQAYANCVAAAPDVFDLSDTTGLAVVLRPDPPPELHSAVQEAVRLCPVQAVRAEMGDEPGA